MSVAEFVDEVTGVPTDDLWTPYSSTGLLDALHGRHPRVLVVLDQTLEQTPVTPWPLRARLISVPEALSVVPGASGAPPHPGVVATRELVSWLARPQAEILQLVGLAESTVAYWRNTPTAEMKPNKGGRLLRLHAVVGLLVEHFGVDAVRRWMREHSYFDTLAPGEEMVATIERDGYARLRTMRPPRRAVSEADWDAAEAAWHKGEAEEARRELNDGQIAIAPEEPAAR
ncbi:hypothetical protein M6B22_13430 [Jatrophihabitans cynanchi]|uniref:XRE family transcriptional regulator n=1 Tax=Jatrophihabitans cynanchi TaxID=2944128 RepID=A0ABY7JSK6_9ACTN|nr:hypothetical protein [Jatrophihabitans sp. SB3-54]WAX55542.1 hypothetical protein M6B22_13430 [Jatrophihabitans sp. SB3-54]